ncbi:D-aminoacyl-tRNA deacylase [Lentibacillus sp. N15]|uniref:D-aminoacyl-tRNA deacylase n=1 Tax=Lentibacillus songyuanensis TaxID=3136161 RepID=UPI0031BB4CF3
MKAVVQVARNAHVSVNKETIGEVDEGLVVLLGVTHEDKEADAEYLVHKIVNMRIFADENGKMNQSLKDIAGGLLSISQFTLYADTKKGRRPSFLQAAKPDKAKALYHYFNNLVSEQDIPVATGEFGAMMDVTFTNTGPVTIIIDSKDS